MGMVDPSTVRALLWVLCSFLGGMAISVFLDTPIPWSVCRPRLSHQGGPGQSPPQQVLELPIPVDCTQGPRVLPGPQHGRSWDVGSDALCSGTFLGAVCPEKG